MGQVYRRARDHRNSSNQSRTSRRSWDDIPLASSSSTAAALEAARTPSPTSAVSKEVLPTSSFRNAFSCASPPPYTPDINMEHYNAPASTYQEPLVVGGVPFDDIWNSLYMEVERSIGERETTGLALFIRRVARGEWPDDELSAGGVREADVASVGQSSDPGAYSQSDVLQRFNYH